jgi:hypothetical protein
MDQSTENPTMNPHVKEAREHFKAARHAMRKSMEGILPPAFVENRRAARKEFLLGLRKLVDAAIEHVEEVEKKI